MGADRREFAAARKDSSHVPRSSLGQRMTHHRALDAAVWAIPMLHFNDMRSAVMESGLINLKK